MSKQSPFWKAFLSGLASPGSIYGEPPDYSPLVPRRTVGDVFADVGRDLTAAMRAEQNEPAERRSTRSAPHSIAAE